MIIKERLDEALNSVKAQVLQEIRQKKSKAFTDGELCGGLSSRDQELSIQPDTFRPSLQRPTGTSEPSSVTSSLRAT